MLTGDQLDLPREVFTDVCADFGARLVACNGQDDHLHLLVTYPPQVAVSRLVNSLKGGRLGGCDSPYRVRTHREHLWSPSSFGASAGGAQLEALKAYIASSARPDDRANPALNGGACAR